VDVGRTLKLLRFRSAASDGAGVEDAEQPAQTLRRSGLLLGA